MQRKKFLFMEGYKIENVYCLLEGKVKEYYCTAAGDECLRQVLEPGCMVSLHKLFDGSKTYSYTCEIISPALLFAWPGEQFRRLAKETPEIGTQVINILSQSLETNCRHNCLCRKPAAIARVAGYLLSKNRQHCNHRNCWKNNKNCPLRANLKPLSLTASDLCLARETFSRALKNLHCQEIIHFDQGVVEILNIEALKELSGVE